MMFIKYYILQPTYLLAYLTCACVCVCVLSMINYYVHVQESNLLGITACRCILASTLAVVIIVCIYTL